MSTRLSIPDNYRPLVTCLRSAFHDAPAGRTLAQPEWAGLLKQAQEHGVHAFLYPWLAKQLPDLFSPRSQVPESSAPAAWRALFFHALSQSALRQRQLSALFADFKQAGIDAVPLKGAWLCETVYDDPGQRTMSDVDLLVRRKDRDAAHARLLASGYTCTRNTLHNPFARDQSYFHPSYPTGVELHWDFSSKMAEVIPPPDLEAIWENTAGFSCCGQPVRQLSLEDGACLLAHHLLSHLFALPLRAHLDLALLLRRFGDSLSPDRLRDASARWRTGACVPFLLRLTSELFEQPLCPALEAYAGPVDPARLAQAGDALFNLPNAKDRGGEDTLLQFKNASWPARLQLVARRIFMPRDFLVLHYPCARHALGIPVAWLLRARDLCRSQAAKLSPFLKGRAPAELLPAGAESRGDLVRWLVGKKGGPA